ncbi:GDSL lipase/esterase [Roridomyces roridus]|uniref:GDSL lipase/esterase n=1 Tax=Roridomyces roridus TaxID=1738132 RepID=A0AAD7FH05_9AGAR|nr:GDSL lipase/esterase [Roridomyces roridus]
MFFSPLCCLVLLTARVWGSPTTKAVVLFGDSYTDQSREHSITNGTYPGKDYQEVYPPTDVAADGGFQWPWYLGIYGNYTIWNYATGGAVCSNDLLPSFTVPDVIGEQAAWFIQDHVLNNGTKNQKLDMDPSEFVVIVFIGTNDVGSSSFVTDSQNATVSIADLANCQIQALRNLHTLGARRFIVNSLIPLQLTRLYSTSSAPTIYYPSPHDGVAWNKRVINFVHTLNALIRAGVGELNDEWQGTAASVEMFDTYQLFEDMYNHPANWFNGSIPANVTGHCHQCPDPDDYTQCGIGDCTLAERDSYMWWDELHPSEQTGRNLAREMWGKLKGISQY